MPRPLNPSTEAKYQSLLERGYGRSTWPLPSRPTANLSTWPASQLELLRAAVRRTYLDHRADPAPALERIPARWAVKTAVKAPTEEEAAVYEMAAAHHPPAVRALALLPLAVGLRSQELLALPRVEVQRAAEFGRLMVTRKGGVQQELPVEHAHALFRHLLAARAAQGRRRLGEHRPDRAWKTVGEILSPAGPGQQYHALWRLVRRIGREAQVDARPHLLRHVFATRMQADGASLAQIQYALGHKLPTTTTRYVHVEARHIQRFMRKPLTS